MAKRYKVVASGVEYDIYLGQIWMAKGNADYRKVLGTTHAKSERLRVRCRGRGDEKPSWVDIDDLMLWIMDNDATPLVVSYEESER